MREEGEGEDGVVGIWVDPRKGLEVWQEDVRGKRNRQRKGLEVWQKDVRGKRNRQRTRVGWIGGWRLRIGGVQGGEVPGHIDQGTCGGVGQVVLGGVGESQK